MLDIQNKTMDELGRSNRTVDKSLCELKSIIDARMETSLRLAYNKNSINNLATYSYLIVPVSGSTDPVGDNDYISPTVKGAVDYVSAAVTKGLSPNGGINFEFVSTDEEDDAAARQATNMVKYSLNSQLNAHSVLADWVMDGCINKNGLMLVQPVREEVTSYRTIEGTKELLKAFEMQVIDSGAEAKLKTKRKINVDMDQVKNEMAAISQLGTNQMNEDMLTAHLQNIVNGRELSPEDIDADHQSEGGIISQNLDSQEGALEESMDRNTIYEAQYKITGYNLHIRLQPIKQHYWTCDPTINNIQDQPHCGFYETMTIQEATQRFPSLRLEEFTENANLVTGALEVGGGTIYDQAIHARDAIITPGLTPSTGSLDEHNRRIGLSTMWYRYDIDNDDKLELIEVIFSGGYVISAREVEFIPVANMCPRRLPNNFYGMSVAESVIAQQEYSTMAARAEIDLGIQTATPRTLINPSKVDWQSLQQGTGGLIKIEDDFDPSKDILPLNGPSGNLAYLDNAKLAIRQDTMTITGMVTPTDTFNPEVMADGNSGIKLQLALTPNQLILDHTIKNCSEGLKEAIWIMWRTLIQYSDDFGVKRLARKYHPNKEPVFIDAANWGDMNFYERKDIQIEQATGLLSAENSMSRIEIIKATQKQFWDGMNQITQAGQMTKSIFDKLRKPHERILYELSVKDIDMWLPTWEDQMMLQKQYQQAAQSAGQDPESLESQSKIQLNQAKASQIQQSISTDSDRLILEAIALRNGKATNY